MKKIGLLLLLAGDGSRSAIGGRHGSAGFDRTAGNNSDDGELSN